MSQKARTEYGCLRLRFSARERRSVVRAAIMAVKAGRVAGNHESDKNVLQDCVLAY